MKRAAEVLIGLGLTAFWFAAGWLYLFTSRNRTCRLAGLVSAGVGVFLVGWVVAAAGGIAHDTAVSLTGWCVAMAGMAVAFPAAVVLHRRAVPHRYDRVNGVTSQFFDPVRQRKAHLRLATPVPESDHVRFLVAVGTRLDPWMSRAEARAVRRVVAGLLTEMDADPAYRSPGPVFEHAQTALLYGRYDPAHLNAYFPPGDPAGVLVALHGHGWNAQLWLHAWRPFADRHGLAVVCPSFGYGNWEHPTSVAAVERALAYARHTAPAAGPVYLAGISQGGCGVGRAGAALADRFAGLVFISPTMEPDVLESPEFVEGWKGRPVLVIQGGRDHNVKPATVDAAVERMRAGGAEVTYHRDPDADHFLFFAKLDEMHQMVGGWMSEETPPPGPLPRGGRG